jgi:hypothetical protein
VLATTSVLHGPEVVVPRNDRYLVKLVFFFPYRLIAQISFLTTLLAVVVDSIEPRHMLYETFVYVSMIDSRMFPLRLPVIKIYPYTVYG